MHQDHHYRVRISECSLSLLSLSCAHSSSLGTRVRGSSSLVSSPHISSPSDLPGSCPTSQLASPALGSSLVGTPSRPASPADEPTFYFPTPPVDRTSRAACPQPAGPHQPARTVHPDPPDSASLLAPTSSSPAFASIVVSTASITPATGPVASPTTQHTIVVSPAPAAPPAAQPTPAIINYQQPAATTASAAPLALQPPPRRNHKAH
jgi:hypothetical protein